MAAVHCPLPRVEQEKAARAISVLGFPGSAAVPQHGSHLVPKAASNGDACSMPGNSAALHHLLQTLCTQVPELLGFRVDRQRLANVQSCASINSALFCKVCCADK